MICFFVFVILFLMYHQININQFNQAHLRICVFIIVVIIYLFYPEPLDIEAQILIKQR